MGEREDLARNGAGHFAKLVEMQYDRVERMKKDTEWTDFTTLRPLRIGFAGGDGIGPIISKECRRVVEFLLKDEVEKGEIILVDIDGLTIENRIAHAKAVPDDVLEEIKTCPIFLKGPTETPWAGQYEVNVESANVYIRRALDLCANVRPVKVPELGIDWTFFRENTEGAYVLGSYGVRLGDMAFDFKVFTVQGCSRLIRLAFDYARKNKKPKVSAITKANVVKTCDGMWLEIFREISKEYPEIEADEWFIDITTAKMLDPKRRTQFSVFAVPNLYGDIITDEAAEIQGGVGTAGSINLGQHYAMFEAIHGTGIRMMKEGRGQYADPSSMMRAAAIMFGYIGYPEKGTKLDKALDITSIYEKRFEMTGRPGGGTATQMADYVMELLQDPRMEQKWEKYSEATKHS